MRPQDLIGHDAYDTDGHKLGRIGTVYLDGTTREPGWVTVRTGLYGHRESFVPLTGAHPAADGVQVDVALDVVRHAPTADGAVPSLSAESATELFRYYGLPDAPPPVPVPRTPKPSDMPSRRP